MKKKSTKESDAKWMRKINAILDGKFFIQFSPAQINLLVFGSKKVKSKKKKVMGFGSYGALIVAIQNISNAIVKPFPYLKTLANDDRFINECNKKIDVVKPSTGVLSIGDIMKGK